MLRDVYIVGDSRFQPKYMDCAAMDPHVHTKYSSEYIQNPVTKWLGVRECFTSVDALLDVLIERNMDFFTAQDHNVIGGALEMMSLLVQRGIVDAYGNPKGMVNCEYDVSVPALSGYQDLDQIVHLGCWGLDYADNSPKPLSENDVMRLHDRLLQERRKGYRAFASYALERELGLVFNHMLWQGNPGKWIPGPQLEEMARDMKSIAEEVSRRKGRKVSIALEVNGDHQDENLMPIELAEMINLLICGGTDAHTKIRAGNQSTIAWKEPGKEYDAIKDAAPELLQGLVLDVRPVETAYEYLNAFKEGRIGIASRFRPPRIKNLENITRKEKIKIIKKQFFGDIAGLTSDTLRGLTHYTNLSPKAYWNWRKAAFLFLELPALPVGLAFATPWTLPFSIGVVALSCLACIFGLPVKERWDVHRMTRRGYKEWQDSLAEREVKALKEKSEELESKIEQVEDTMDSLQNEKKFTDKEIEEIYRCHNELSDLPDFNAVSGLRRISGKLMTSIFGNWQKPKTVTKLKAPKKKK